MSKDPAAIGLGLAFAADAYHDKIEAELKSAKEKLKNSISLESAALALCFWCNELGTHVEKRPSGYYHINKAKRFMQKCDATAIRIEAAKNG